jgi:hypothetical protein
MTTLKLLPVPIRLPLDWVDVMASRTGLTCVGWWHKYDQYASNCRFVIHKQPKLVKRPVIGSTPLSFTAWQLIKAIPDSGQVLKRQRSTCLFGFNNQLFGNIMVQPFLKPTFSARKPAEQSATVSAAFALNVSSNSAKSVSAAFALNVSSNSAKSVSDKLNLFTTPGFACGRGGDIPATKINAYYLGRLTCWWSVYLNHKVDVVVALLGFTQGCAGKVLPSKQCNLIAPNSQLKINSSTLQRYPYRLGFLHILKCADIQTDRSRSELMDLFDRLGVTNYTTNSLANMVGFQPGSFPYRLIDLVVKLGCIPAVFAFSYLQYLVASIRKSPQSLIDLGSKLYRDYKLAFNRQGLIHEVIIPHPSATVPGD